MDGDALAGVRSALERQDWDAALVAATAAGPLEGRDEADRADALAESAWWLGRIDDCTRERERAHVLYEDLGDSRRAGMCAVWLWEHHMMSLRPAIAGAWLRRARRLLDGDVHCVEHCALVLREAEVAHGAGDVDGSLALVDQVIEVAAGLRSADIQAEALQARGRVLIDRGDATEGMGHMDEAMLFAVGGRLGPYSTGKVYCSLISACEEVDDFDRAAEWTEATLRWAQRHPFAIFPGICRMHRAVVLKRRGSLAAAEVEALRACQELSHTHRASGAAAYREVGDIRRRLGQLDRAEEALVTAQELSGRSCGSLAMLRLAQGQVEAARSIAAGCLRETTNRLGRAALLPDAIHVAIAAGDLDDAAVHLVELEELEAAYPTPTLKAAVPLSRGRLQLAAGDPGSAEVALREALQRWEALAVPYEVATTRTLLGQALRDRGDDEAAAASFALAAMLFEHIGATLDSTQMASERRSPPRPNGLTEREVEVLQLIAAGLTNNDIAAALHLSAKTVSRHLSNIFTKIGVTSRTAAAAFAYDHGMVETRH